MSTKYDHLLKILLIGDSGIGKSTFLQRYTDDTFSENYILTIGVDFKIKEQSYATKKYKLQIWDTAGQERFRTIASSYYRGAHCILIMFDLTDIASFNNVKMWLGEVTKHANENSMKILIGTKADLIDKIAVRKDMIQNLVYSTGIQYIETSAKNGTNIDAVFQQVCSNFSIKFGMNIDTNNGQHIQLQNKQNMPNKKNCCL